MKYSKTKAACFLFVLLQSIVLQKLNAETTANNNFVLRQTESVKLLLFEAQTLQKSLMMRWIATEENFAFYELQRSSAASDFKTIATIAAKGSYGNPVTYHFDDANVLFNQVYFYRLKQVDSTGVFTFSKTVTAMLDKQRGLFSVSSKPYQSVAEINYELLQAEQVKVDVHNSLGNYVCTLVNTHQEKGSYNYLFNPIAKGLPPGIYCIRMAQGKATYSKLVYLE